MGDPPVGTRIRARVLEGAPGQHATVTKVDDVPEDHGPGEFVNLEWDGKVWREVGRFGTPDA